MNIKTLSAIWVAKISKKILILCRKSGTTLPGKLALKLDKDVLKAVSHDTTIIMVTGTNGKTTTTAMIVDALIKEGKTVFTNFSGANMISGITTCFIDHYTTKTLPRYAVIEVDEASLKHVTRVIEPHCLLITNVFRDQMDRYGEVHTTLSKILEGVILAPRMKLILNGDEPLFHQLGVPNQTTYFGFNHTLSEQTQHQNIDGAYCKVCSNPLHYDLITYNHLGKYFCQCGVQRPNLSYHVDQIIKMSSDASEFIVNAHTFSLPLGGVYNIYNALSCISVCHALGVQFTSLQDSLSHQNARFGRQEVIQIGHKQLKCFLVKNPAGFDQSLETLKLDPQSYGLVFILNDLHADGLDVSWIYDVNFEAFAPLKDAHIIVGGTRAYDMATRLAVIESIDQTVALQYQTILQDIIEGPEEKYYVFLTYTAMIAFRKFLSSKGYIETFWN